MSINKQVDKIIESINDIKYKLKEENILNDDYIELINKIRIRCKIINNITTYKAINNALSYHLRDYDKVIIDENNNLVTLSRKASTASYNSDDVSENESDNESDN
jgi:hypothetical protein